MASATLNLIGKDPTQEVSYEHFRQHCFGYLRQGQDAWRDRFADGQSEKLNWQRSIVDLMKLLKLDSSFTARKQLAQELGYKGSLDGSAEMNIWLHNNRL